MNNRIQSYFALALLLAVGSKSRAEEVPTVAVAAVTRQDLSQELTIQAEFRPYQEVELHAMVAGYLQKIDVDFGDRVKSGDVIATLEVPELNDELAHAVATKERAAAAHEDAHLDYTRLCGVNKSQPNLVAPQELDAAEARDRTTAAEVAAAQADTAKYQTLLGYTRITAPFDGVITARYADPGSLIQTGSSQSLPLVRLSENQLLRLDFPVSVSYVDDIAIGEPVEIRLVGSGSMLKAKISRFSRRVDMATRTMETEVQVPNPDLKLVPGMYATVTLRVHKRPGALAIPVEAVAVSANPTVYVVGRDGMISERAVKLGIETPGNFEVLAGVGEGDFVVIGSRSAVHPGERVEAKVVATSSSQ
jgi:RND family efflux transporter MFP subunit